MTLPADYAIKGVVLSDPPLGAVPVSFKGVTFSTADTKAGLYSRKGITHQLPVYPPVTTNELDG